MSWYNTWDTIRHDSLNISHYYLSVNVEHFSNFCCLFGCYHVRKMFHDNQQKYLLFEKITSDKYAKNA